MKNKLFEIFVCMVLVGTFFVVTPDLVSADQDSDYTYTVSSGVATITAYTGASVAITIPSTLDDEECSGFVATGSVVKDGRSIFLKNRHMPSDNQKPNYFSGSTYDYWGVGTAGQCRMGMNEKGLFVGNLDVSSTISEGNRDFLSGEDYDEDNAMKYVLGNFETVTKAAIWLAQHQAHDGQAIIISSELGIGAIVCKGTDAWANISYINNTYTGLGNGFYCEGFNDGKVQRMNYFARRVLEGYGRDPHSPNKLSFWDVTQWAKDINASDASHPWWSEPKPGTYTGTYAHSSGIATGSSRSATVAYCGNDSYDGALNIVWLGIGRTTHCTIFLPIGCSYVDEAGDLNTNWTAGNGIDQYTSVKYAYAYDSAWNRQKMHQFYNYTRSLENMTFEDYDNLMATIMTSANKVEASERIRTYANVTMDKALQGWIDNTTWIKPNNPPNMQSSPSPANGSTNTLRPPVQLEITITDLNNNSLDVSFHWKNHTGTWVSLQTYTGVGNGVYTFIPPTTNDWIWGNTIYTWSVNVTDRISWTNETYHFTTGGSRYDVNNNDIVNFQDAGLVWVHRTSIMPYDGLYDVNQDIQVNFQDARLTWVNRD
jgi:hypothetical protein